MVGEKEIPEGYKQTEVGVVPEEWGVRQLSELVFFLDNQRKPIESSIRAKMRGEYPYYGASGIVDYVNNYIFDDELILLGEDGENILSRNLPLAFMAKGKFWVNNHAHVLKPLNAVDIVFLTTSLERIDYSMMNSGTAQPKLNKQACYKIRIPLPPLPEQKAIAEVLSDTDALIESLETLIAKKRAVKQGSMQELLTGRRRLPGFAGSGRYRQTEVGVVPEEWGVCSVRDCAKIFGRIGFRGYTRNDIVGEGKGAISLSPSNIKNNKITFSDCTYITWEKYSESPEIKIAIGDIVFVKTGSTFGKVAEVKALPQEATLNPQLIIFKELIIDGTFFTAVISHTKFQTQIKQAVVGGAIPTLSQELIYRFPIPLPPLPEQKAIAEVLSDMDTEIEALEKKRDKYKKIKQGTMDQLLTGKVRLV